MTSTERRSRSGTGLVAACGLVILLAPLQVVATDPGPQNVVRQFCRLDANGARLIAARWREIAPLVAWPLDPAWDRILFITGYQIGTTRALDEGQLAVDVDYGVIGEATAAGFEAVSYTDRVTFILDTADEIHWHIVAPMIAPRVFASLVPTGEIVATLKHGRTGFISSSLLIHQLMHAAGWRVPYERTADLAAGSTYAPATSPQPGDIIVWSQDGVAYHAGILDKQGEIISATLNGGVMRTTANAFLGDTSALRLVAPATRDAEATPTAVPSP